MPLMNTNDLMTQTQAAKMLGITVPSIHYLIQRGRLHLINVAGYEFLHRGEVRKRKALRKDLRRRHTSEEMLGDVLRVANKLGRMPSSSEYRKLGKVHLTTICKRFGGWPGVVKSAHDQTTNCKPLTLKRALS
jgi:Homing endonuclease associated repeat